MQPNERLAAANQLKAAFNLMWDRAITSAPSPHSGTSDNVRGQLSYLDMTRIADAMRSEGPKILGLPTLPKPIDSGLAFACAAVDPNKARAQEAIKQGLGGLGGAGGLTLAWVCLGQLLNPGVWATVVAFVAGGVAGGPMSIVGVAAGLLVAAGAVYAAFQKMSPQERAVKAHDYVVQGINNWVEYGSDTSAFSYEEAKEMIRKKLAQHGLTSRNFLASSALVMQVAHADGVVDETEQNAIKLLLGDREAEKQFKQSEALSHIKRLDHQKACDIIDWCFQVAHADGEFHPHEVELLKHYCFELDVDFFAKVREYGIRLAA